jgi:hypothetical protein
MRQIATVATENCKRGLSILVASLRARGWREPVRVYVPEGDALAELPGTEVVRRASWWGDTPLAACPNAAALLKCDILADPFFRHGDSVLYMDGADTAMLGDPCELFALFERGGRTLAAHPFRVASLDASRHPQLLPRDVLAGKHPEQFQALAPYYNNGVFLFRAGGEAAALGRWWRSLELEGAAGASPDAGRRVGDQQTFNLMLRLVGNASAVLDLPATWNFRGGASVAECRVRTRPLTRGGLVRGVFHPKLGRVRLAHSSGDTPMPEEIVAFAIAGSDTPVPEAASPEAQPAPLPEALPETPPEALPEAPSEDLPEARPTPRRPRALVAGPCFSEFGWELCEWVGYVLKRAEGFDHVVVCSRAGREALYGALEDRLWFVPHRARVRATDHRVREELDPESVRAAFASVEECVRALERCGAEVERFEPPDPDARFRERFADFGLQVWPRYGRRGARDRGAVVVHMRDKETTSRSEPNYPEALWREVVEGLRPYGEVLAVGTVAEALCFDGMRDLRGIPLAELFDVLADAAVCVGPSSGPMHLASLCGCPHVAWTNKQTTLERYEKAWNPHGTRCVVLKRPGSSPPRPEDVLGGVRQLLGDPDTGRGVVYVACGEAWRDILAASLSSLRAFYAGAVAVLAPEDEAESVRDAVLPFRARVVPCRVPTGTAHTRSRYLKTSLDLLSPFGVSLYLDCDTFVLNPLDGIWDELPEGADVCMRTETACPTVGSRDYRNSPPEEAETVGLCGPDAPHWHSSTILFRKSLAARVLFAAWRREWARHGLEPKFPRVQDQPALARAAFVTGAPIRTLPARYNARHDPKGGDALDADTVVYSLSTYTGAWKDRAEEILDMSRRHKSRKAARRPGEETRCTTR